MPHTHRQVQPCQRQAPEEGKRGGGQTRLLAIVRHLLRKSGDLDTPMHLNR